MKKLLLSLLLMATVLGACTSTRQTVWIDVRSVEEYQSDHIANTLNIPHEAIASEIVSLNLAKSTPIKLFCRSGRRADLALETLTSLGYSNVINVGGIADARLVYED